MIKIFEFNKSHIHDLEVFLRNNYFDALCKQAFIDQRRLNKYFLHNLIASYKEKKNNVIIAGDKNKISGLIVSNFSDWDTSYFGMPMSKIDFFLTGEPKAAVKETLLGALLEKSRSIGIKHLNIRVDLTDTNSISVLEGRGFKLLTVEGVNIISRLRYIKSEAVDLGPLKIRYFRNEDANDLIDIGEDIDMVLKSHYYFDCCLPKEKRQNYYLEKIKNLVKEKNNSVLVVTRNKKVIGFFGYYIPGAFSRITGSKQAFVSLFGVSRKEVGKNVAFPFIYHASRHILEKADFITGRVYLHNQPMSRLLDKICPYPFSQYLCCFHKPL
jgi:hypothetical protein